MSDKKTSLNDLELVLNSYKSKNPTRIQFTSSDRTSIVDQTEREKKLKNDDVEQDIRLKKQTLNRLFLFLAVETALIFIFTFLQATGWLGFALDEWSFKLLTTVTISQITIMLFVAVNYLFPKNRK